MHLFSDAPRGLRVVRTLPLAFDQVAPDALASDVPAEACACARTVSRTFRRSQV
jgi:hypothetical protein